MLKKSEVIKLLEDGAMIKVDKSGIVPPVMTPPHNGLFSIVKRSIFESLFMCKEIVLVRTDRGYDFYKLSPVSGGKEKVKG